MVTSACFSYNFPWQESSLCKMYTCVSTHTCVLCKEFNVCILGCSIILCDGDSNQVKTN